MKSIEITQQKTKQTPPTKNSNPHPNTKKNTTDVARTPKELDLNSEQFKLLFDNFPQAIALHKTVYDKEGTPTDFILLASNKAYNKIRFPSGDHLAKKQTLTKTGTADLINMYGKVAKTGTPESLGTYYNAKDKWFQIYLYSPKKPFVISKFMDITKQKKNASKKLKNQRRTKKALLLAERRYSRFFETSRDGIMARDIDGKMIDCNKAYAKMIGYTKKELKNLSVRQILPELWHEQREKIVKKVLKTGRSIVFEREYKRKDGSVFPASVRTWRLIDPKGKVIGVWSIVRDITEQKKQQENLEQQAGALEKLVAERTKQLQDAERLATIGQTAGMVGHDLRNPLQTVLGELYLAKNEIESISNGSVKSNLNETIQIIEEQIVYMDKIVSDLQAFVQPVNIDKKPFNLKQLIESVLETVTIPQDISVHTKSSTKIPQVKADPQLLKRVLINLVNNANQAMPNGGILTICSKPDSKNKLTLYVQDTGVGISDQIKNQIFKPLFTTKPRGQGFGLAVCKRVIDAHGGKISFESQIGKGTRFTIQLPNS